MKKFRFLAIATGTALVTAMLTGAASASHGQNIDLDINKVTKSTDGSGKKIKIIHDDEGNGERHLEAEAQDGSPVDIYIQSALPLPDMSVADTPPPSQPGGVSHTKKSFKQEDIKIAGKMEPVSGWASTPNSATLVWKQTANAKSTVSQNGSIVTSDAQGKFTASDLQPGTEYTFEIETMVDAEGTSVPSSKSFKVQTTSHAPAIALRTYQKYSTAFQYKTFIPDYRVGGKLCNRSFEDYQFAGDNRGFAKPSSDAPLGVSDYRTMMWANVNWNNPDAYKVITQKGVGKSLTYKNGNLVDARYADMSDMKFENISASDSYAQVRFNHKASNPHCEFMGINYGGAITYNVMNRFYRSGLMEVVGWRQKAPAHEAWTRFNTSSGGITWQPMLRLENAGFHCLIRDLCATETINKSRAY